jgi:superfamily II DNA/RNA helicase
MNSFTDFGLRPSLLKSLKEQSLFKPTEIQSMVIPLMMSGQSVVGVSETGSGKTLAYSLPLLHLLKTLEDEGTPVTQEKTPRAVIMVPSRELGEQVAKVLKTLTHDTRLRVRAALGGMPLAMARKNTAAAFEVLLASPARLVEMLELELIDLSDVRMLIFDEADQMMDQGFLTASNIVIQACPKDVQLSLFSATVSPTVQELMNEMFMNAEVIRSKGSGKTTQSLITKNLIVENGKRWPLFEKILNQKVQGGTMIFTNTREQCDKVADELRAHGYECAVYRGEMDKNDRRTNLKKFRNGEIDLLVSTDLGGRGLDIYNVSRVINYHLPKQMENYIHRAGRTARAGRSGVVYNLVTERDQFLINKIEGKKSPIAKKFAESKSKSDKSTRPSKDSRPGNDTRPAKEARFEKDSRPKAASGYEKNSRPDRDSRPVGKTDGKFKRPFKSKR